MIGYSLVPKACFKENEPVCGNNEKQLELPEYKAVLVFDASPGKEDAVPPVADLLRLAPTISEHNRVVASLDGECVHIVVAEGTKLLLCNSYPATDIITAEYFIFAAVRKFQINPEVTTIYLHPEAPMNMRDDLFRYFKGVELI